MSAALEIVKVREKNIIGTVDAVQLTPENGPAVWEWADSKPYYEADGSISGLTIFTFVHGRQKANFGDWIFRSDTGYFYPVSAAEFTRRYSLAAPAGGDNEEAGRD